ncbi:MAG: lasso RiPP family leader peptide-containing protein [Arenicella sp.]
MRENQKSVDMQRNESAAAVRETGYQKPELICYGDVRDITLGGSVLAGESLGGCIDGVNCP